MSLTKDCSCRNHEGPHWLLEDYFDRKINLTLLERWIELLRSGNVLDAYSAMSAYNQAEIRRTQQLLLNMKLYHLTEVRYLVLGESYIAIYERERVLLTQLQTVAAAQHSS